MIVIIVMGLAAFYISDIEVILTIYFIMCAVTINEIFFCASYLRMFFNAVMTIFTVAIAMKACMTLE